MWARVVEFMLACWLAISPFVLRYGPDDRVQTMIDFALAATIMILSLLSFWSPTRNAHLLTVVVALLMIGYGRFASSAPLPAALQNYILVGLLLLMFGVVPNHASRPPRAWEQANGMTYPEGQRSI